MVPCLVIKAAPSMAKYFVSNIVLGRWKRSPSAPRRQLSALHPAVATGDAPTPMAPRIKAMVYKLSIV